jgi:hypothetical protein
MKTISYEELRNKQKHKYNIILKNKVNRIFVKTDRLIGFFLKIVYDSFILLFILPMTTNKTSQKSSSFVTPEDKKALLTSLSSTMQDVWRLPWLIFAPVLAYVSAHFAKIPDERKSHLKNILDEIKAGGSEWVDKLKDWFKGMLSGDKKPAKATKKAPAKKAATKKTPTKKPTSLTDKISSATKSATEHAKTATTKVTAAAKKTAAAAKKAATAKKTPAKKPARKATTAKKTTTTKKTTTKTAAKKTTKPTTAKKAPVAKKTTKAAPKKK